MGHAIGPSTAVADVLRQRLRQKKDVVYGLLFLLHGSADLPVTNPIRNPSAMRLLVTEDQLRCFVRYNQWKKITFKSSYVAQKSCHMLHQIHQKRMLLRFLHFTTLFV